MLNRVSANSSTRAWVFPSIPKSIQYYIRYRRQIKNPEWTFEEHNACSAYLDIRARTVKEKRNQNASVACKYIILFLRYNAIGNKSNGRPTSATSETRLNNRVTTRNTVRSQREDFKSFNIISRNMLHRVRVCVCECVRTFAVLNSISGEKRNTARRAALSKSKREILFYRIFYSPQTVQYTSSG